MFYNKDWHYSQQDIDVGDLLKISRNYRRLHLRMRCQIVDREVRTLWRRSGFYTRELKERFGENFQFKIERNPIAGVYYKQLTGYVLWRTWYRIERTMTGGFSVRRDPQEELVAVVLGGAPIWRLPLENPTVTDRVRNEFAEAFSQDVASIDDLLRR